ncbi:sigma factor-like helix-turn-helix DNA-binding protein [Clostridium perfringens]|uniref:sigma factor-like helix-turn-helix DNA-binding protein n=1 Tax=Clostridium TaxID=1485 RepID=UPI0007765DF6|nr:sigma factor-like helix-turn-helix DNA-binding protein [Clostridium perfringens]
MMNINNKKELENLLSDYKILHKKVKDFEILGNEEEANKYKILIARIDNAIDSLSEKEKAIIELRYIEGMGRQSWKLIAESLYISNTRCHVIKNRALESIIKLLGVYKNGTKTV